jgi:hypothetical protein
MELSFLAHYLTPFYTLYSSPNRSLAWTE